MTVPPRGGGGLAQHNGSTKTAAVPIYPKANVFLRRLAFPMLFCQSDGPPYGRGDCKRGGGGRGYCPVTVKKRSKLCETGASDLWSRICVKSQPSASQRGRISSRDCYYDALPPQPGLIPERRNRGPAAAISELAHQLIVPCIEHRDGLLVVHLTREATAGLASGCDIDAGDALPPAPSNVDCNSEATSSGWNGVGLHCGAKEKKALG